MNITDGLDTTMISLRSEIPLVWCIVCFLLGISGFVWSTNLLDQRNRLIGPKDQWLDEEMLAKFIAFCICLMLGSIGAVLILFLYHVFN